jgi:hypothetical protein
MVVMRPGETQISAEGSSLKVFWKGYTTAPGDTDVGMYTGHLIRDNAGVDDGYAELVCSALKFSDAKSYGLYTVLRQTQSPMRIFSIRRGLDPFLMFSCRLDVEFNDAHSMGVVSVMSANDEDYSYRLKLSVSNVISFYYLGEEILVDNEVKSAIIDSRSTTMLRTKTFDFFISAKRLDQEVVGLRARYQVRFNLKVGEDMYEIHRAEAEVRFQDYFQSEFLCEAEI